MVDRSLKREELAEIRQISTRADISPTSFTNFYTFGNFKGDQVEMMFRWYDAHLYTANWGTRELMFAMPRSLLNTSAAKRYLVNDRVSMRTKGDRIVIAFTTNPDDGGWYDEEESDGWLDRLITLRADLILGDFRALYLGWLSGIQEEYGLGYFNDEEKDYEGADLDIEPPVPPGLRRLTVSLEALVELLRIDQDLLAIAAKSSADLSSVDVAAADIGAWVRGFTEAEKDVILTRLVSGEERTLAPELLRRYRESTSGGSRPEYTGRRVADLLTAAEAHAAERKRREEEIAAKEAAKRALAAEQARAVYLDKLSARQEETWRQIEQFISTRQPLKYKSAVELLIDLRDLGERDHGLDRFEDRLLDLRNRHPMKWSFLKLLDDVGLI